MAVASSSPNSHSATGSFAENARYITPPLRQALALLLQSHEYAQQLACCIWDFSVEVATLREIGVTQNDLRWLACMGWVEHAREITHLGDEKREFRPTGRLNLARRSCCVLTEGGVEFARGLDTSAPPALTCESAAGPGQSTSVVWDSDRRQLRVAGHLVKEFKLPSPNQQAVLAAFEKCAWPARITDPLPVAQGTEPRQRLRDTIKSLNRNHKCDRIRFKGDGTGQGIVWELKSGN